MHLLSAQDHMFLERYFVFGNNFTLVVFTVDSRSPALPFFIDSWVAAALASMPVWAWGLSVSTTVQVLWGLEHLRWPLCSSDCHPGDWTPSLWTSFPSLWILPRDSLTLLYSYEPDFQGKRLPLLLLFLGLWFQWVLLSSSSSSDWSIGLHLILTLLEQACFNPSPAPPPVTIGISAIQFSAFGLCSIALTLSPISQIYLRIFKF